MATQLCRAWAIPTLLAIFTFTSGLFPQASLAQDGTSPAADKNAFLDHNIAVLIEKFPAIKEAYETIKDKRDVAAATLQFKAAVKSNDMLPPAEVLLALIYATGNNQAAHTRKYLEEAIKLHPKDPAAYFLMANLAIGERRWTEASLLLDKTEGLIKAYQGNANRKRDMQIRYAGGRAALHEKLDQWDAAKKYFEQWVNLDKKNSVARYRFARCLFRLNNGKAAMKELETAYKNNDTVPVPPVAFARFFTEKAQIVSRKARIATQEGNEADQKKYEAEQEKYEKRTADWYKFAEKEDKYKNNDSVYFDAAKWYWGQGNAKEVLRLASKAVELAPDNPDAKLLLGKVLHVQGKTAEAEKTLLELHQKYPKALPIRLALALVRADPSLNQSGSTKLQLALQLAGETAKNAPNNAEARATYGWIMYSLGKKQYSQARKQDGLKALNFVAQRRAVQSLPLDIQYFLASASLNEGPADSQQVESAKKLLTDLLAQQSLFAMRSQAEQLSEKQGK